MQPRVSRRKLLATAALTAAGNPHLVRKLLAATTNETLIRLPGVVRVGIIGLEGHYSEILEPAKLLPQIQIVAIAERDEALLQRASGHPLMKAARVYGDYRKMLDEEKLDVVAVCGENGTRASIVRSCSERKIPVVAEKPLAVSLEELEATKKKVSASGVPLTMLLPMRFYPQYQAMHSIIAQGEIGEVVSMGAQKSYKLGARPAWMRARKTFGGTIPYIGIHMVDLMRWVSGREFVETAAFHSRAGFPEIGEMENNTAVIFRTDNQGTACLRMDYLRPAAAESHGDDRLLISGTRGVIEYQEGRDVTLITGSRSVAALRDLPPPKHLFVDFLDALYNGRKHLLTPDEIYRVTEIVLKSREAADSGRVIKL